MSNKKKSATIHRVRLRYYANYIIISYFKFKEKSRKFMILKIVVSNLSR